MRSRYGNIMAAICGCQVRSELKQVLKMLCRDHHELLQGFTFSSQLPRREWTCKSCAFASWRSLLSQPCPCRKDKGKEKVKEKGAQTDVLIRWPASIENSEFLFFG